MQRALNLTYAVPNQVLSKVSYIFKKGEYREDIVDLQLYLTKMDIEEEKNPQENFAHDVKMKKTLSGRACL